MENYKVLLIDTNNLFSAGLRMLLAQSPFEVIAQSGSQEDGVSAIRAGLEPDLVLFDLLDDLDGDTAEAMRRLRALRPTMRIVVLASEFSGTRLAAAFSAGADGYLMKDLSAGALVESLRLVMMGEKVFPGDIASLVTSGGIGKASILPVARKGLSQREIQILRCLLKGDSNKMIARQLNITEATVKVHLKSLLRKINVTNRTQAAVWALNNGLDQELLNLDRA